MWFTRKQQDPAVAAQAGTPLELVRYNTSTGKFEAVEEALHVLRKVKSPVGVVAVSGRARQGKSFILNQLLGQSTGFKVAPTVRPCTKGLWMWSSPVRKTLPDGRPYHLVLLDTEGIDAYDQTGQYSTQIFSLAVLLSSLFVYNQMGGIDEAALDRLSLVTEMTKHIRVRANEGQSTEAELSSFTPSFLWLLRDFYLTLEDNGRQVTAREYLETALAPVAGRGAAVEAKNQIRESIKALFPDRDCFTLVRPVNDEKQLQSLDSVPPEQLRPEFREALSRLTQTIFQRAHPKKLGSLEINGPMLAGLAQAYVTALNEGAVPTIATAWQGVAESECRRAADAGESAYMQAFNQGLPAEEAALDAEHQRCLEIALEVYAEAAVGYEEPRKANEKRLRESVDGWYANLKAQRLANAALGCERMIREATSALAEVARAPGTTTAVLQQDLKEFERRYRGEAAGPTKWQLLNDFLQGTFVGLMNDVAERERMEAQQRALEAAQRAQQAELKAKETELAAQNHSARARKAETQRDDLERQLEDASHALETECANGVKLKASLEATKQQMSQLEQSSAAEVKRLSETVSDLETRLQAVLRDNASLKDRERELEREVAQGQSRITQLQSSADSNISVLNHQISEAKRELQDANRQATELRAALVGKTGEAAAVRIQLEQTVMKAGKLERQLEEVSGELTGVRGQLGKAEEELQSKGTQMSELEKQLSEKDVEIDALKSKVGSLQGALSAAETSLASERSQLEIQTAAVEKMSREIGHLSTALQGSRDSLARLQADFEAVQLQHKVTLGEATRQLQLAEERVKRLEVAVGELNADKAQAAEQLRQLEGTVGQLNADKAEAAVKLHELQQQAVSRTAELQQQLDAGARQHEQFAAEVQNLRRLLSEAELERHQLSGRMSDMSNQAAHVNRQLEEMAVRGQQQAAAIAERDAKIAALEHELQAARRARDADVANSQQAVREQLGVTVSDLNSQLLQLKSQLASLHTQVAAATAQKETLSRQLQAASAAQQSLETEVSSLRQANMQLTSQYDMAVAAQKSMQEAVAKQQGDLERWKADQQADMNAFAEATAADATPGGGFPMDQENGGASDPSTMTVAEMKEWLMQNGGEAEAWGLSKNRKAKKQDWLALVQQRMGT